MKNIEINTKAVKKVFAAGLLALTMTGCGGNSEPTKEETPQGETTEEVVNNPEEDLQYEEKLKDVKYSKGDLVGENKIYKEEGIEFMSQEETALLKAGDSVTKVPDRKTLEEMGLDFVFVYEAYAAGDDGQYETTPAVEWTPMYIFPMNEYEGGYIDENGEYAMGLNKWTGKMEILEAEYKFNETDNYWEKNLYKEGEFVTIGKIYSLKNFSEYINSYQKTK